MSMQTSKTVYVLIALISCLVSSGVFAEAYSIPVSTRLVKGELSLSNGDTVQFAVLEGGMLTVRDSEEGYFLGFTPIILDQADLKVRFNVFEITEYGPGEHVLREVGVVESAKSVSGWVDLVQAQIQVSAIEESGLSQPELEAIKSNLDLSAKFGGKPQSFSEIKPQSADRFDKGTCCVTCGSTKACGCAVSMSCGSCCSDTCCGGGGEKPTPEQQQQN